MRKSAIPSCITVIAFTFWPFSLSAINLTATSVKGMAQAYGFLVAQDSQLVRIARDFPELSPDVALARARFNAAFPEIEVLLKGHLKRAMGTERFEKTEATLRSRIREAQSSQALTREGAERFPAEVTARAKGAIDSPVLEYLLAVKYDTSPVQEFADGFRQRYQTDASGKAQGIKLRMQLPRSWAARDGERPHIVQKWTSENGNGLRVAILDIRDAEGYNPSKDDIRAVLRSGALRTALPKGATYVSSGEAGLEGQAGYWLQTTAVMERAEAKIYQAAIAYQFYFRGKAIGISCQTGDTVDEKSRVSGDFERLRPLCQQIVNSVVLTQAY